MSDTNNLRRKVLGVPLSKDFSEKTNRGTLLKRGYFTSDFKDEVGDIITRAATEAAIPSYRKWGNIRYMHQPRPVGKVLRIGAEDGLDWNEIEFEVIDPQTVFEVENGLLNALSVGILVNFDDIDFLEDGGWVINSYKLAEISLVDHPANYDATLKAPVDVALRTLVRNYGFDTVAWQMYTLLGGDKNMDENAIITEAPEEEQEVTEVEVEEEAPVIEEEKELDPVVEAEEVIEPEEIVGEEPVVAEEVSEEAEEAEEEIEEEEEAPAEEEEVEDEKNLLHRILNDIAELRSDLNAIKSSLETIAKSLQPAERVDSGGVEVAGEDEVIVEAGAPVNRQAAVIETEEVDAEQVEASSPVSLRKALFQHFQVK